MSKELAAVATKHAELESQIEEEEKALRDKRKELRTLTIALRNGAQGLPLFPDEDEE